MIIFFKFRLLATAPTVQKTVWGLTKFFMNNLYSLFIPRFGSSENTEYDETLRSIYDDDPILKKFNHIENRKSIVSLVDSSEALESDFEIRGNMLSRRNSLSMISRRSSSIPQQSLMISSYHSADVDTLDQVVTVAANHDTLYSYYYTDETDKTVKHEIKHKSFYIYIITNSSTQFFFFFNLYVHIFTDEV